MVSILGPKNRLHLIIATRLGVVQQVIKNEKELSELYPKLGLSASLVYEDVENNHRILTECFELGKKLSK